MNTTLPQPLPVASGAVMLEARTLVALVTPELLGALRRAQAEGQRPEQIALMIWADHGLTPRDVVVMPLEALRQSHEARGFRLPVAPAGAVLLVVHAGGRKVFCPFYPDREPEVLA